MRTAPALIVGIWVALSCALAAIAGLWMAVCDWLAWRRRIRDEARHLAELGHAMRNPAREQGERLARVHHLEHHRHSHRNGGSAA